jgi:DNA-binding NarL/FixJ family response regulator
MAMESEVISVLVVDDHALHRDGTRHILEQHPDLEVVGDADSGEKALALIRQLNPDVVLMDIRLPGMNGIEATRRIRKDHPEVRVLMVTAHDDDEYVRGAVAAGAAGYLSKTAPGRKLVEAVRAVAAGTTVLEPAMLTRLMAEPSATRAAANGLTEREFGVLKLLVDGLHNKQVARHLGISLRTVERHCDNIYDKLGVGSRTEAVVWAISSKLVSLDDDKR